MDILFFSLFLCSYIAALALASRYYMHMFQLNAYKPAFQLSFIKNNMKYIIPKAFFALITVFVAGFAGIPGLVISTVLYAFTAYLYRPQKAKIPLAYTNRVKYMFVTFGILTALVILLVFLLMDHRAISSLILFIWFFIIPYTVLLVNIINSPLQKHINNKFIDEAKDILKSMPDLKVIGITGSFGKTSVKHYLTKILESRYNVLMTPKNYNTTLGVVRTVRENLRATHEIFVCEMGARQEGDIKEICDLVHPNIGIITAVGEQHLETFKSLDNIKKTKFELADSLPAEGTAFLNGDDENINDVNYKGNKITYGINKCCDYRAGRISATSKGLVFTVTAPDGKQQEFTTKLLGYHNVQNLTGAIAVANQMGIEMSDMVMAVKRLEGVPHRLQLLRRGKDIIIDDAYNSNPTGTRVALATLSLFADSVKVLVTPGMVELGDKQEEYNARFGEDAAKVCDYIILVGLSQTKSIADGAKREGFDENKLIIVSTIEEAFAELSKIKTAGRQKVALLENDLPDNF